MANAIKLTTRLELTRASATQPEQLFTEPVLSFSTAGDGLTSGITTVTTSAANISITYNGTIGLGIVYNLDTTNYIQLGWDDTGFVTADKIPAGKWCVKWFDPSRTWQWQANTASCKVRLIMLDV